MRARTLLLKRESLSELTPGELGSVAGAEAAGTPYCPTSECVSLDPGCLASVVGNPCLTSWCTHNCTD